MNWLAIKREAHFLLRKKQVVLILVAALALSLFAVWTGSKEVAQQHATIERLLKADAQDRQAVLEQQHDYGGVAYYSFHLTYSAPSPLAFASLGVRDVYPWKHRIRMLALEGQIHESDTENPELALAGRIDFAFVISVLAPFLLILLLHDLRASERAAGRLELLTISNASGAGLWLTRAMILSVTLGFALLLPFWIGAILHQVGWITGIGVTLLCLLYLGFWALLSYSVAKLPSPAPMLASILLGVWLITSYIVPAVGHVVIEKSITGPKGGDILMTQREAVNDAWDLPFSETFDPFVETHPEWENYTQMPSLFDWKWYYAFQQVGDQKAQALSEEYRRVAQEKYQLANLFAVRSPATALQRILSYWAQTDAEAAREYEQSVRNFHQSLREFYYPLLFKKPPFKREAIQQRPEFTPNRSTQTNASAG
ncbi:DUF3526 domain-containing protein [Alteromonas sp. a30]|uniref:DUF3526 domain-containing protein n=1 Tax=Alteromonas sp. a30 TaxID=2730917 RepID=UPI0022829A91|nr:DUF3526 domain-containing protein [Alteromonas sp. a30]MCY7295600.1 DUF3526 domain-containing protein [Alteromonas sp. a30]